MDKRRLEELFFRYLTAGFTYLLILLLFSIVFEIFVKGFPAMSWDMVTKEPSGGFYFGREGGILNAIVGSFYISLGGSVLAFLVSLPIALFINIVLIRNKKIQQSFRFILDLLWGIPPIVYGAFGFAIMLFMGLQTSLLAGILTIAVLISPIMIRAMDEVIRNIPTGMLEAAYSLGATGYEVGFVIYLRQALPGIVTAFLLGFSKGIGDTASVLFTAGFTDFIPTSLNDPAATLPLAIFYQLSSPLPEVKARAYASAVVLTGIILLVSLISRLISSKFNKSTIK